MLIAWAYNELGENITPTDQSFDMRFSRPAAASSDLLFKVGNEHMRAGTWGAKSALTDITVSAIQRGVAGAAPSHHKAGDAVWIQNLVDYITPAALSTVPSTVSSDFTNGDVWTIVPDGTGGYYVGGDFDTVAGAATYGGIARINAYGVVDTTFKPIVAGGDAIVRAIYVLPNGNLIIGGDFTTLDGQACVSLGMIDIDGNFVTAFGIANASASVNVIAANSEYLYVAGLFLNTFSNGPIKRYELSGVQAATPTITDTDYDLDSAGEIFDMVVEEEIVYIVGNFTSLLTSIPVTRNRAAAIKAKGDIAFGIDPQAAERAILDWNPNLNNACHAILKHGDYIYMVGLFSTVGGTAASSVARVDLDGNLDTTWAPAAFSMYTSRGSLDILTNTTDGEEYLVVGGAFFAASPRTFLINLDTAAFSWFPDTDDEQHCVLVDRNRILMGGGFTTVGGNAALGLAILSDQIIGSEIGVYKLEWLEDTDPVDPVISVRFEVFFGAPYSVNLITDELVTTGVTSPSGTAFTSTQFTLTRPAESYIIRVSVNKASGTTTTYSFLESGTTAGIVLVPDGVEIGDQYDKADTFAAPGISKVSSTYNLTPATQAGTPTATNPTHYWRMWLIVDPAGGYIDDYQVTFNAVTDTVDIVNDFYYFERIGYDTNGTSNLTVVARDSSMITLVSTGPHSITSTAASRTVDADQIQMEYEFTDGAWTGRVIADWQDIPGGGVLSFNNIGPAAHQFRFRYRYRTFRRDGIDLETGRPVMVSQWSSWTVLT